MFVKRSKDIKASKVMMHKIADVRGGVSIQSEAIPSGVIVEGAVIATDAQGKYKVLPSAKAVEALTASGKALKVAKFSNFAVGQNVTTKTGAVASKINSIDSSNKSYDVLNLAAAIGAVKVGESVVAASSATTSTDSTLLYEPFAVCGTTKEANGEYTDVDAWVIGVTENLQAPASVVEKLKGIVNIVK